MAWLKDFFDSQGEVCQYQFWQYLQARARVINPDIARAAIERRFMTNEQKALRAVSYDRIRVIFWMLRKVNAIEKTREEPGVHGQPKVFYIMTDPAWFIPRLQTHFYPATQWGGMRYRSAVRQKLVPKIPAPPAGRESPLRVTGREYWKLPPRKRENLPATGKRRPRRERGT